MRIVKHTGNRKDKAIYNKRLGLGSYISSSLFLYSKRYWYII